MSYFTGEDLKNIELLQYDETLKPRFDVIKYCLIWEDEMPEKFTSEGYEKLCDLWIARSFIFHRKLPRKKWGLNPGYFENAWKTAVAAHFKWPGFYRLELKPEDEKFLIKQMKEAEYL